MQDVIISYVLICRFHVLASFNLLHIGLQLDCVVYFFCNNSPNGRTFYFLL